ncbi:MAG: leucyl aminopeptidase [Desulfobulbus sp.]|nr:MAG: leucyl aminopeptidase [Desulfobulbus sp.]
MLKLSAKKTAGFAGDMLVYFLAESGKKTVSSSRSAIRRSIRNAWKSGDFTGKTGESYWFYPNSADKDFSARRVLVVGLGKLNEDENLCREQIRLASGTAVSIAQRLKVQRLMAVLPEKTGLPAATVAESMAEGLILSNYRFDKYKTGHKSEDIKVRIKQCLLHDGGLEHSRVRQGMNAGKRAAEAACVARNMANEPGNGWTPAQFAQFARDVASASDLSCRIIDKSAMKKLGMGGILGVNQGSALPPKLVILKYKGAKKWPTLMLVGKGLTFDSGGISLKPAAGMEDMKYDMCGGAAVICAMQVIAKERPKGINVVALIPATENLSGASAIKPGDIITHYGGITSEVINTDAEGRLILADALAYGIKTYKPDAVVDLATLTGAVIVGLGHHRTGLLSTDDELVAKILDAGERAGEPLWRLPLGPEYSKQINSKVADIRNIGGKGGGTITAACYLQEFVGDTPWAHLDIAGTAWNFTEKSYVPKGPSGIAVRTLVNLVRNWKKN